MLSVVLMTLLCYVMFIFRFISVTIVFVFLNYVYYFVLLNTLFVAGLFLFFCAHFCVFSDCLPDYGTDIQYKQRLYPC